MQVQILGNWRRNRNMRKLKKYWKRHKYQKVIIMLIAYFPIVIFSIIYKILLLFDVPEYLRIMFEDFKKNDGDEEDPKK